MLTRFKKFISLIFATLLFVVPLFSTGTNIVNADSQVIVLNVISCEDYIDSDVIDEFNDAHPNIYVNYQTLATPEDMYNELKRDPKSVDLICPSEYMIMKMMEEGLIKSFSTPQNMIEYGSPYINNVFKSLVVNVDGKETPILSEDEQTTYAVGYMWGTMGFTYNMDDFDASELNHWSSIVGNSKCYRKTTIKDSIRDTYIMSVGAVYQDELMQLEKDENYNKNLTEIFNRTDDQTIAKVESYLQQVRTMLYGFEVDSGKDDVLNGRINVNFAWSGDSVYAMDCGDEVGVTLGYVVPEEGSNVWFDGYVMSKACTKESQCVKFLNYLADPEIAIRNMEETGYTSVIGSQDVYDWLIDYYELETEETEGYYEVDLSYFFSGEPTGNYKVYSDTLGRQLYAQYSDWETIQRCAVMSNFDTDALTRINAMWNRVRLFTFSLTSVIIIIVILVLIVVALIIYKYRDKIFSKSVPNKEKRKLKNGWKVVKIEKIK